MVIYIRNDRSGLELLDEVMKVYPEYKKENVADTLYQTEGMQLVEVP